MDDKFILVFGGKKGDKTSFKFYPENNEVKMAEDLAASCDMDYCPEPFYDKTTKAVYAFDCDARVHKFDQYEKWSIAIEDF